MLDSLGEPYEWKTAGELAARLGTKHFHAGIYTPGCILLNPAALTRGLADNLPENVALYENTPVTEFSRENGITVRTAGGAKLFAPKMILATNAFTEEFGFIASD